MYSIRMVYTVLNSSCDCTVETQCIFTHYMLIVFVYIYAVVAVVSFFKLFVSVGYLIILFLHCHINNLFDGEWHRTDSYTNGKIEIL